MLIIYCFIIFNTIQAAFITNPNNFVLPNQNKIIVTIGITGNGKSTLCNLLAGNTLIKQRQESSGNFVYKLNDSQKADTLIGQSLQSNTTEPTVVFIKKNNDEAILDLPGLSENRNFLKEVFTGFSLYYAINHALNLKIILVIDQISLENDKLKTVFQDIRIQESLAIGLVVTKVTITKDQIKKLLIQKTMILCSQQPKVYNVLKLIVVLEHFQVFFTPEKSFELKLTLDHQKNNIWNLLQRLQYANYSNKSIIESKIQMLNKSLAYAIQIEKKRQQLRQDYTTVIAKFTQQLCESIEIVSNQRQFYLRFGQHYSQNQFYEAVTTHKLFSHRTTQINVTMAFIQYLQIHSSQVADIGREMKYLLKTKYLQAMDTLKIKFRQQQKNRQKQKQRTKSYWQQFRDWF